MASIEFNEQRLELFPTSVFRRDYEGLEAVNHRLRQLILEKEKERTGVVKSNVGGHHSDADLLTWDDPAVVVLSSLVRDAVHHYTAEQIHKDPRSFSSKLKMEAWANVSRFGDYNRPHVHPSTTAAVVYYVDVGDEVPIAAGAAPTSGVLEFLDPRQRPHMFETPGIVPNDNVSIVARESRMLVFPAWLYHYVHPYRGERPRISIAANVTVMAVTETEPDETQSEGGV